MSVDLTAPTPSLDTQEWWNALADGVLTVPSCAACASRFFPPQPRCPRCGSADVSLVTSSSSGRVYSWVTTHRPFSPEWAHVVPYAIVAVDLDDGARLIGRFLAEPSVLRPDLAVTADLYQHGEYRLLGFVPSSVHSVLTPVPGEAHA